MTQHRPPNIVNLWVERKKRERAIFQNRLWECRCGSDTFEWREREHLVCVVCGTSNYPVLPKGWKW